MAELDRAAKVLLTEEGYLNAMAGLYDQLTSGDLTRDQTSALIGARRCLESFAGARADKTAAKRHAELCKELQQVREAMAHQESGAIGLSAEQVQLPRRKSSRSTRKQ